MLYKQLPQVNLLHLLQEDISGYYLNNKKNNSTCPRTRGNNTLEEYKVSQIISNLALKRLNRNSHRRCDESLL